MSEAALPKAAFRWLGMSTVSSIGIVLKICETRNRVEIGWRNDFSIVIAPIRAKIFGSEFWP
jgi:hypothetical protein